jgi:hypothetical protein
VSAGTTVIARRAARVRAGRLAITVPAPGLGRFTVALALAPHSGLAAASARVRLRDRARTLSVGSRGADVRALAARLAALRFHVPRPSLLYDASLADAVVAFQKAAGLPRTGVVTRRVWRALGRARPLRPRSRTRDVHLEIDKSRQILLVVRRGRVAGVLPVSTGATGNTPEGFFRVLWKAPSTTTWLGPAILYRTLTFHGGFAIHGFASVPVYPASHGCVRVPIWAADWLYTQTPVGERVYIY